MNSLLHLFFSILQERLIVFREDTWPWSYKTHTVTLPADTTRNPFNLPSDKPWKLTLYLITAPLQGRYRSVTFRSCAVPYGWPLLGICEAQRVCFEEHSWRKNQLAYCLLLILE